MGARFYIRCCAHIKSRPQRSNPLIFWYAKQRYRVSIPKFALVCLTFVYTVHTYGLIGAFWFSLSIHIDCYCIDSFNVLYSAEER